MEWEPLDNAGGYNGIDATKDHMLAFLGAYRLLDVLSLYDARTHSQTLFTIPKNPRLPILAGKKVGSHSYYLLARLLLLCNSNG